MSYSKLRQDLKKATGMPPARFLANLRCEAARMLLSQTDMSVKQVGPAVGIAAPAVFCRVFRRHVGMSASQFRRLHGR